MRDASIRRGVKKYEMANGLMQEGKYERKEA